MATVRATPDPFPGVPLSRPRPLVRAFPRPRRRARLPRDTRPSLFPKSQKSHEAASGFRIRAQSRSAETSIFLSRRARTRPIADRLTRKNVSPQKKTDGARRAFARDRASARYPRQALRALQHADHAFVAQRSGRRQDAVQRVRRARQPPARQNSRPGAPQTAQARARRRGDHRAPEEGCRGGCCGG